MTGLPRQFETGIYEIDIQHVEFIALLKNIQTKMGSSPRQEEISSLLAQLSEYARKHFKTEKEHMERAGYPGLTEHMEEHGNLLQQIEYFEQKYKSENSSVAIFDMVDFMETWLLEHIPKYDTKFAEYLKANMIE